MTQKQPLFKQSKLCFKKYKKYFLDSWWITKKKDKFKLTNLKKNIIKSYIIGKNINFFKKQIKNKINFLYYKI